MPVSKPSAKTPRKTPAAKEPAPAKTVAKPAAKKPAEKKTAKPAVKKPAEKKTAKPAVKKAPATKAPATKETATKETATKPAAKKPTAPTVSKASQTAASSAKVWRIKVLCVAGPYWDADGPDICLRTIDLLDNSSLYDLHAAILESVHFEEHDESVFTFFTAANFRGRRTYLGDGRPLTPDTDIEAFEDIPLATALPADPKQFLFYVFDADDPWVFLVGREPTTRPPSPHEFYPFVRDELNNGPDPVQNGDGLDDFADADEGAEFGELRRDFRRHRREREESGLDDYDDDSDGFGFSGGFPPDDGFFSGDDGDGSYFDDPSDDDGDDGDDW